MASIHAVVDTDTTMTDCDADGGDSSSSSDDGGGGGGGRSSSSGIIIGDHFLWCESNDGHHPHHDVDDDVDADADADADDFNREDTIQHHSNDDDDNEKDNSDGDAHGHGDEEYSDYEPLPLVDFEPIYAASRRARKQQQMTMMMMNGGGSMHEYSRSISSINTDWSTATTKISNTASGNKNNCNCNNSNTNQHINSSQQKQKKKRRFLQFTKVLMKLLERKDPKVYDNAKTVIQQCEQKKRRGETNSVTDHLKTPLKQVVGYEYWHQARTEAAAEAAEVMTTTELLSASSQQQRQQQQQQQGNKNSTDLCCKSTYYHSPIDRLGTNSSVSMEMVRETFSPSKKCFARSGPVNIRKDQTGRNSQSRSAIETTINIVSDEAFRCSHNSLLPPPVRSSSSPTSASHNNNNNGDWQRRRHPHNHRNQHQDEEIRERKKRKWMIISVMMKYLQGHDDDMYIRARGVVNECLRRHRYHRDRYKQNVEDRNGNRGSLSGYIEQSLKREIGFYHWRRAESYVHRRLLQNWNEEEGGRRRQGECHQGRQEENNYMKHDEGHLMYPVGTL